MAKKSKKFDSEQQVEGTTPEPVAPAIPKAPSFFLCDENGVEYKFDKRNHLPKKSAVAGDVYIDGLATPFQVTSNKGFTVEGKIINYSWLTLPDGKMGYITHDYETTPVAGVRYTLHEGKANRANPERVPKDDVVGAQRVEKFKTTMSTRKAAVEPTPA